MINNQYPVFSGKSEPGLSSFGTVLHSAIQAHHWFCSLPDPACQITFLSSLEKFAFLQ